MTATVAVIGGGPAGLMAAETAAAAGASVMVYERMPSLGRKLLMAGRGGLNLTHSEPLPGFLARYGEAQGRIAPHVEAFSPGALRAWAEALGQPTFAGPSGRVFPEAMKASPLLRAWLARLAGQGVGFALRHDWRGWRDGALLFQTPDGEHRVRADAVVLAVGGASWPKLGATGAWAATLQAQGLPVAPFQPANVGFSVAWSPLFRSRAAGQPLKAIAARFEGESARGDLVVTAYGLEGGPLYALGASLRRAVAREGRAALTLDLRPDLSTAEVAARLARAPASASTSNRLRKGLRLSPAEIGLLREGLGAALPTDRHALAAAIKACPVALGAPQPLDRAISTAGGLAFDAVTGELMIGALPGVFAAGEMLDWEAPTGGYLLQAAFATGATAGRAAAAYALRPPSAAPA